MEPENTTAPTAEELLERIRALALEITDLLISPKPTAPGDARKKAYEVEMLARDAIAALYPERFTPVAPSEPTTPTLHWFTDYRPKDKAAWCEDCSKWLFNFDHDPRLTAQPTKPVLRLSLVEDKALYALELTTERIEAALAALTAKLEAKS